MTPMPTQVTFLSRLPCRERFEPVRNPEQFPGGDVIQWLKGNHYRGNKPFGGLWTSSHTAEDDYPCDWQRGIKTNKAIQVARPPGPPPKAWLLTSDPAARVLTIASLRDASEFTRAYVLGSLPIPVALRSGIGLLITAALSDWERALRDCDAIRLTGNACDEIMYSKMHGGEDTAFDTWHCESTLWGAWRFSAVAPLAK